MNVVFTAILLWLGTINSPAEATPEMVAAHKTEIETVINDEEAMAEVRPVIIWILELE